MAIVYDGTVNGLRARVEDLEGEVFGPDASAYRLHQKLTGVEPLSTATVLAPGASTARTLGEILARFEDVINVKAAPYLAAGDGVTDDTAAIQAADAAAGAAGKPLVFPAGTYRYVAPGSTYVVAAPAWLGAGQGNTYNSLGTGGGTIIRCEGANAAVPVFRLPVRAENLHFDGVDLTATGIAFGADGTFTGFQKWRNLTVRRFNIGIAGFNFYSVDWQSIVVQGNHEGVRIAPTDGVGDDGYFTSTSWTNVHIADNDVAGLTVSAPLGTKTWVWTNVVIERNAASGTAQAYLENVVLAAGALYVEGTSAKPGIKTNNAVLYLSNGYMNGTGGIDASSAPLQLYLSAFRMVTATDVIAGLSATAYIVARDGSRIQTDVRTVIGGRADIQMTTIGGTGMAVRQLTGGQTAPTYGATVTIDAKLGQEFVLTPTDGEAFTINSPANRAQGQRITIRIRNTFGVLGAVTWGTSYKLAAWAHPANGYSRSIDFQCDGTNWIEVSRTPADVPN